MYRTPLTLPYDVFPTYMAALDLVRRSCPLGEFQTHLTLKKGECLVMNNWRTMQRPRRQVAHDHRRHDHPRGLTRRCDDAGEDAGVAPYQEVGVASPGLVHMGSTAESPPAAAAAATESVRRFRAPTS